MLFVCEKMVRGRRGVDLEFFNMLRKIVAEFEAIELEQDKGRYIDDEYDSFWDELHERIDDLEQFDFSRHLRI